MMEIKEQTYWTASQPVSLWKNCSGE